jgi:hypothetical protein
MSDTSEKLVVACPNCNKQYRVGAALVGKQASCKCGTVFRIESPPEEEPDEYALTSDRAPVAKASATDCVQHPGTPAVFACADCRKLLCRNCSYTQLDGRHLCSDCAIRSASPNFGGATAISATVVTGTCQAHRDVEAVARCQYCNTLLCRTCDFAFPGDLHLCPHCATTTSHAMSRSRKILLIGSYVTAGWVIFSTAALFIIAGVCMPEGMDAEQEQIAYGIVGILFMVLNMAPSVIGFGMACGTFERRGGNSPLVWVSLVMNSLLAILFLGLMAVGSIMG